MDRYFKMTATAQRAMWCQLSNEAVFVPTQFMVEGDAKSGYTISYVDDQLTGFECIRLRSFHAVKFFVKQVNETGTTDMRKHCTVGTFAWAHISIPSHIKLNQ